MFASKQFLFPSAPAIIPKVFGVRIDTTNPDPETALTYTDDSIGITDWTTEPIFKDIKPCLLKEGNVQYYLNPLDFSKKLDGTNSDITSGNDGDVMIKIPKFAYMMYQDGIYQYIKITNSTNAQSIDSRFHYYAHTRDTEGDRANLYVSAYLGYNLSSKLRSLKGYTPTTNQTISTFRTQAQANGTGYDMLSFYPTTALQCLYVIKYKNLNSQVALGRGLTYVSGKELTGTTYNKGMYYGESQGIKQMKFAGIEDFWGNCECYLDGIYLNSSRYILVGFENFNNTGSGYINRGQASTANIAGISFKIQGSTETGFLLKTAGGSANLYYCDYSAIYSSRIFSFGGYAAQQGSAGCFFMNGSLATTSTSDWTSARLMYL